jgi:heme-degrading monooxygenase HmoA
MKFGNGNFILTLDPLYDRHYYKTTQTSPKEADMAVKVLIKRSVTQDKAKALIPLVRKMRASAARQEGYITGETLRSLDNPEEFLVISTWQSSDDWKKWLQSEERNKVQKEIDDLLGGETNYEIFHYGFSE